MTDDEVSALQEELMEVRAENDRLQMGAADTEARIRELTDTLAETRDELASAREDAALSAANLGQAVAEFRRAALAAEPDLPPELVSGETVDEVLGSLDAARATVRQVRERLTEERGETPRIPPGSPARRGPDLGALSARQKITEGLRRGQL